MGATVERVTSGIPGLDKLIEGGFVKNSVNLLAGQTGTGKTLFGMQYLLEGLKKGENGIYITLEQSEQDILDDIAKFGWDTEFLKAKQQGKFILLSEEPADIKSLQFATLNYIKKINARRFVLDSLSIATMGWKISSMDIGKVRSEIMGYLKVLKTVNVTSLLITEIPEADTKSLSRFGFEEFLADGVIVMHYLEYAAGGTPRSLLVRKMRRTSHGTDIYPIEVTKNGILIKKMLNV